MWLFFILHISTNTHVSLELAIIREVYTLFFNTWDLLKGKCSIFFAKNKHNAEYKKKYQHCTIVIKFSVFKVVLV